MSINKLIFAGQTLLDLTQDTVSPGTLLEGITAHAANGSAIVGTLKAGAGAASVEITSGTFYPTTLTADQDLSKTPIMIQHQLTGTPDFFLFYATNIDKPDALQQALAIRADTIDGTDFAQSSFYSMTYGKKGSGFLAQNKLVCIVDYNGNSHNVDQYITLDEAEVRIQTPETVWVRQYDSGYAWVAGRSIKN